MATLNTLVEKHGAAAVANVLGMTERYIKRCMKSGRGYAPSNSSMLKEN